MNITIRDITETLARAGKVVTEKQAGRYVTAVGRKAMGARQRPQLFPPDTASLVLRHLGLSDPVNGKGAQFGVLPLEEIRRQGQPKKGVKV